VVAILRNVGWLLVCVSVVAGCSTPAPKPAPPVPQFVANENANASPQVKHGLLNPMQTPMTANPNAAAPLENGQKGAR